MRAAMWTINLHLGDRTMVCGPDRGAFEDEVFYTLEVHTDSDVVLRLSGTVAHLDTFLAELTEYVEHARRMAVRDQCGVA